MKQSVNDLPKGDIPESENSLWVTTDGGVPSCDFSKYGFDKPVLAEVRQLPQVKVGYRIENNV